MELREEGYTVRTDTHDGIVVLLSVMAATRQDHPTAGYVGHVSVVAMRWQSLAETLITDECKENHTAVQM
jgi:hypothetical protein